MNREIKFRAWCNLTQRMLSQIDIEERTIRMLDGENDQVYMQYTGLKDKNGKEIYEGDIVNKFCYWPSMNGGEPWYEKMVVYIPDFYNYVGSYEVIGNIYENPQLLDE